MSRATLEDLLERLTMYGRPRLSQFSDRTWYCVCETHTMGYDLSIKSSMSSPTPTAAAAECLERCTVLLPQLGSNAAKLLSASSNDIPF